MSNTFKFLVEVVAEGPSMQEARQAVINYIDNKPTEVKGVKLKFKSNYEVSLFCQKCGKVHSQVINSRQMKDRISRRRRCLSCGFRWSTHEVNVISNTAKYET